MSRTLIAKFSVSVFDALQQEAVRPRVASSSQQDTGAEVSVALRDAPLCFAKLASLGTQDDADDTYDFRNFGWINPRGLWGSSPAPSA